MTERVTLRLHEPQQAHKAFAYAWTLAKGALMAGHRLVLGQRTSRMGKAEMAELQTLMEAFGAEHEVAFTAPDWMGEEC